MIERTDDLGRTILLDAPAQRIVCLVPSITETLFYLGAGGQVVGITDYCVHPEAEVKDRVKVGGTKNFRVETILGLRPDLVVANAEENRKHQVEKLEQAGIGVWVSFPKTVDGCVKMIRDMGVLSGTHRAARRLVARIEDARSSARQHRGTVLPRVLCPIWKDPFMTVNHDTYVDSVIRACGGDNIFADRADRYPNFTLEEAAALRPDVILLPTEPYRFSEPDKAEFIGMGETVPAVRDRRIHIVEGELLSWYGPRLARALREIPALLRTA